MSGKLSKVDELLQEICDLQEERAQLAGEVDDLQAALKRCCQCRFTDGKLVEECHYHQCQRHVRLSNGDPSNVTLLEEIARLSRQVYNLEVELRTWKWN